MLGVMLIIAIHFVLNAPPLNVNSAMMVTVWVFFPQNAPLNGFEIINSKVIIIFQ